MHVHLKVKIKTLATEAAIIRLEGRKTKARIKALKSKSEPDIAKIEQTYFTLFGLTNHRRHIVRDEARAAQLAYGYLRGRRYRQLERWCYTPPPLERAARLVGKFGQPDPTRNTGHLELLNEWAQAGSD